MAHVRRLPRTSTSAPRSSPPVTPTTALASPSLPRAGKASQTTKSQRSSLNASSASSLSKVYAKSSYDNPIVLSDTDSNADTIDDIGTVDSFDSDMRIHHGLSATPTTPAHSSWPLSNTLTANNQDESRSSTTLNRSYATSLNSDLHASSDGSLSSLSSPDSDSDSTDVVQGKSQADLSSPERTHRLTRKRTLASSSSRDSAPSSSATPTPSRKSARIVSSGSSVQKALQRRDELDAKLLSTPVRRKAESPQAPPPAKRPRGRPRKSNPVSNDSLAAPLTSPTSSTKSSPPSTIARRSRRLSMTAASQTPAKQATPQESLGAGQNSPQESDREPRRSRRSQGVGAGVEKSENAKQPSTPWPSSSLRTPRKEDETTIPSAGANTSTVASATTHDAPIPVKRGPGRPRKVQAILPPPPQAPSSSAEERKAPAIANRRHKRSSSSAGASGDVQSQPVTQSTFQLAEQETPRRKRGRPRVIRSATSESVPGSPATSQVQTVLASPATHKMMIDLVDEGLSELSDASDVELSPTSRSVMHSSRRAGAKRMRRVSKQDKDGKAYHDIGLYAGEADAVASTSSRRPVETPNPVFPTPIHFGARLLTEERDFCLPYPIHKSQEQLRARVNAKRKPPPYKYISRNRYYSRKKVKGEVPQCECKPGSGCGASCWNRHMDYICDPETCPSASNCTNISLSDRPAVKTEVAYYGRRGFGLKTLEPIKEHEFIDEYRGEIIDLYERNKRVTEEYAAAGNYYLLDYDSGAGEMLDSGRKGNITRFANHSCDPNCRIEKFVICGTDESRSAEYQIGLFAKRDIEQGEELTYDYGWSAFQPRDNITGEPTAEVPRVQCLCGSAHCSGFLGGKKPAVPKAVAEAVRANSRIKTAKGRGKGKGKTRKAGQGTQVRMRAMPPLLNAARLSAAGMPSAVLLTARASKVSRTREQAQASLNLLDKFVTKRRKRSEREAGEIALSTLVTATDSSVTLLTKENSEKPSTPHDANMQPGHDSDTHSSVKAKKGDQAVRASGLSAAEGQPRIAQTTSIASSEALSLITSDASSEASASQSANTNGREKVITTLLGKSTITTKDTIVPRLPISRRLGAKRKGAAFRRATTSARGTKDRRWSMAEALVSDDDETASPGLTPSDSDESTSDSKKKDGSKERGKAKLDGNRKPGRRGRHKLELSGEETERRANERKARNAFLARVRRASKRGIVIEDPTQHPLRKISIECTAAPDNTYIPDLPSSLVTLGMATADARRARNAFLARVRRAMKRGFGKEAAIKMAAKPLPGDPDRDTPVMKAQRAYMERIEREAADDFRAAPDSMGTSHRGPGDITRSAEGGADESWVDESSWAAMRT